MKIEEILSENLIELNLKAKTKVSAIRELIELLYQEGIIHNPALFLQEIYEQAAKEGTILGNCIAIPYGQSETVAVSSVAIGRTEQDMIWDSFEDMPVRIVLLVAVKKEDKMDVHLQSLRQIACSVMGKEIQEKLLTAEDEKEMITALQNLYVQA